MTANTREAIDARRAKVAEMAAAGATYPEIQTALGVGKTTVWADLKRLGMIVKAEPHPMPALSRRPRAPRPAPDARPLHEILGWDDGEPVDWREEAACAQTGPDDETWFPAKGGSNREAKALCQRCPSRQACLDDALRAGDIYYGIRGGASPRERQRMLRIEVAA